MGGVGCSLGAGAAHGGAEASVELEHHELVEQSLHGVEICSTHTIQRLAFTQTETMRGYWL